MSTVSFIGLGVMGYPMAGHLHQKGHQVTVYNRSSQKAQDWLKQFPQGKIAYTPQEAAAQSDFVLMCVGNDQDIRSVVYGEEGILAGLRAGSLLIDHTTASADIAHEISAACALQQAAFIDAPVSGGQVGAEKGQLTVMCGGDEHQFKLAQPILQCFAKAVTLMGGHGMGQLTKMVNQICIAGIVQGLSEALHFSQQAGLDGHLVLEVISKGAAQSWQMENRGKTMLEDKFDFGFAVDWMRKDLNLVLDEARKNGSTLPLTALIDQFYADVQQLGGGRWDTSSLIRRLSKS
ncbi:MAG: oxidoreductase [Ferrovum sp. 37-45-19]|uniref:NAD(P)-dependent oxidoreductase n=1 Tax=Ferrovum sp. JA12 TaxID=1356299 RepID=UPI0007039F6C|nr:NAD(P)-dependent oxidoreductase [Ferrovum sp. JA12]OYV80349.1 MAG: oxidoreductase [Ferrovum sp. 21-44-67]OYV95093.1 MAG: oxidoreductase [Ferrovum sp. 37-45-19]OZB31819.1 MAG: oxidoreductase [Ferrovum sp. 34-44-207]HQT80843.1 NAD(P)-dependent oxidoreductase [Ferrovaceae bacterium]KRH78684.1 2-hydroxy-3-oxopropionate reductase [Ferrovum sp. JA12]